MMKKDKMIGEAQEQLNKIPLSLNESVMQQINVIQKVMNISFDEMKPDGVKYVQQCLGTYRVLLESVDDLPEVHFNAMKKDLAKLNVIMKKGWDDYSKKTSPGNYNYSYAENVGAAQNRKAWHFSVNGQGERNKIIFKYLNRSAKSLGILTQSVDQGVNLDG
jgi:hypothetical protein